MEVGNDGSGRSGGAVAGSVWERRMRSDEVKGGIKVFGIVEGVNDGGEDLGVKVKRAGNSEKESSATVRKSRRTWRNRDEPGKGTGLHPVKEFFVFDEVGEGDKLNRTAAVDDEACKELGVCHVGRVKTGSGLKVQQKLPEFGNGGNDDDGDEFFDDEGLEGGDGFNDGNEEVDLGKSNGSTEEIRRSTRTEQKRTRKVVSGDKKVNNHFTYDDGEPKSIHVRKGTPPIGSGVHKECRKQDSSGLDCVLGNDGCLADVRIVWQSLVDLVMWRDAIQTAFVFGLGTLVVILSSFTGNFDISFISLVSHLGFFALATVFVCKSVFSRLDLEATAHAVQEEEALNFTRLVLPYINTFLSKFRALSSGDPAITMKLAILLFVIARWVDYLSVGVILKLGFIGAFTVPKLCSKYSKQIQGHGKSWIRRMEDAWDSWSHKRAVGFVAFLILWNFSSAISRVCLVFLVYLALRYHEHSSARHPSGNSHRGSPVVTGGKGT
ncbi:hypothetical protein MLD38_005644 [Melastoma candidum]|uniref:Uncharacterized protein n=1 Tax=Melastoma candidum TaxID=119954 RepID=A0ACB9RKB0_9MYRT|nr:hypothetical protein MLD38_005644 [Melastoma candidum]